MRFGFCTGLSNAEAVRAAGYDYIEPAIAPLLRESPPERPVGLDAEAFNVFLPGDLKVTGPAADLTKLVSYAGDAFALASRLGGKIVVFGSGGARSVPDGFSQAEALEQIVRFLSAIAPLALAQQIVVAIEPLNRSECNIVSSVAEGMDIVRRVSQPSVRVLSDLYHVDRERQPFAETRAAGQSLAHVHVAGKVGRRTPIADDTDYLAGYFAALKAIGYDRRVSVEAQAGDLERDAAVALEVCHAAWNIA